MAKSIRILGAEDSTLPCGSGCRIGRRCSIPATSTTRCSCPSCCTVVTTRGVRCSDHLGGAARLGNFCATPTAIFQPWSRPCANTGCPPATPARADCGLRGTSYRLRSLGLCLPIGGVEKITVLQRIHALCNEIGLFRVGLPTLGLKPDIVAGVVRNYIRDA